MQLVASFIAPVLIDHGGGWGEEEELEEEDEGFGRERGEITTACPWMTLLACGLQQSLALGINTGTNRTQWTPWS